MRVEQLMTRDPVCVDMDDELQRVGELFAEHGFHHLLVVEGGRLVGVISDRDLLRHLSPFIGRLSERTQDLATLHKRVHQIMSRAPVTVGTDTEIAAAAALMLDKRVSCLPVVAADGRPIGILSWRDLLAHYAGAAGPV